MDYKDNYKNCVWVKIDILKKFIYETLVKSNVPKNDAKIIADVLIESDKRGIDSHGIGRLKPIYIDRIDSGIMNPVTEIEILKETKTTAVLDAHNGMGHVAGKKAMQMAIKKAKRYGLGMVAVRNSNHYGIAGYYATMASDKDMIGITGTNARPSIAPTFGVENMLGTNPLTFAIPTNEEFPFVLDCATSTTQRGKIEVYARSGKKLPTGWVIGEDGESRSDTEQVLVDLTKGLAALTPLGGIGEDNAGYKGYGYAVVVEILSAALQDGKYMKDLNGYDENHNKISYPLGHFFIAINPEFFMGVDVFKKISTDILTKLRNSKKAPNQKRIYTAGEKEHEAYLYRKEHGIPVPLSLQKEIIELTNRWNLKFKWNF